MKNNNLQKSVSNLWPSYKVDEVCTLVTNGFVGTATTQYTNESDGVLYIQGYNITEGGFNFSGIKKVNKEFHKKNSKSCLKFKDLLTIQTGDCGLTSIVPKELEGANCHALIISRFKPEIVNSHFVYYFYNSEIGRSKLKRIETGSTMKHINVSDLKDLELSIPTLSEQDRIISVLETWDKSIEKLTHKIEVKRQIKKSLMQELLTGKKRLHGFNEKWESVKLGEIATFKKGKGLPKSEMDSSGKYEAIHYGELFTKYNEQIEDIISRTNSNKNMFLSKKNDILMPTSDVTPRGLSTASYIDKDGVILGGDILVIRSTGNLHGLFFCYLVNLNKKDVIKLVSGSTVFHLYGSDMAKFELKLPPLKEQESIVKILITADKEITELEKKLSILKEQKRYLLNNLITGTIRTPETLSTKLTK
jgi:type I restriction enzyme S subunit